MSPADVDSRSVLVCRPRDAGEMELVGYHRIRRHLRGAFDLVTAVRPDGAVSEASKADAVVAYEPHLDRRTAAFVETIGVACSGGLVLVTPFDAPGLRHLAPVRIDAVIFEEEIDQRLIPAVDDACRLTTILSAIARCEERDGPLPGVVGAGLERLARDACSGQDYVGSLRALADRVGCSVGYLRGVLRRRDIRGSELVRLCFLLSALRARQSGSAWERVALRHGYRSVSGLSEAFLRRFGKRTSHLDAALQVPVVVASICACLEGDP
ncbi:MAG: hypothetical protein U5R14_14065 [Gemmatimonadota bacterium]|nr:hypothetical protein [Gemmatimonadota bacterium]